ncbi:MAG: hypothetical protein OTJ97_03080 [SAR202 cluster bacterium]|nr:hypothetical protein [SAR202 cluster bacterium]
MVPHTKGGDTKGGGKKAKEVDDRPGVYQYGWLPIKVQRRIVAGPEGKDQHGQAPCAQTHDPTTHNQGIVWMCSLSVLSGMPAWNTKGPFVYANTDVGIPALAAVFQNLPDPEGKNNAHGPCHTLSYGPGGTVKFARTVLLKMIDGNYMTFLNSDDEKHMKSRMEQTGFMPLLVQCQSEIDVLRNSDPNFKASRQALVQSLADHFVSQGGTPHVDRGDQSKGKGKKKKKGKGKGAKGKEAAKGGGTGYNALVATAGTVAGTATGAVPTGWLASGPFAPAPTPAPTCFGQPVQTWNASTGRWNQFIGGEPDSTESAERDVQELPVVQGPTGYVVGGSSSFPKGTSVQPRVDGTYGDLNEPAERLSSTTGELRMYRTATPAPVPQASREDNYRNPMTFEVVQVEGPDAYSPTLNAAILTEVCRQLGRTAEHAPPVAFSRFNNHRRSDDQIGSQPELCRTFSEMCRVAHSAEQGDREDQRPSGARRGYDPHSSHPTLGPNQAPCWSGQLGPASMESLSLGPKPYGLVVLPSDFGYTYDELVESFDLVRIHDTPTMSRSVARPRVGGTRGVRGGKAQCLKTHSPCPSTLGLVAVATRFFSNIMILVHPLWIEAQVRGWLGTAFGGPLTCVNRLQAHLSVFGRAEWIPRRLPSAPGQCKILLGHLPSHLSLQEVLRLVGGGKLYPVGAQPYRFSGPRPTKRLLLDSPARCWEPLRLLLEALGHYEGDINIPDLDIPGSHGNCTESQRAPNRSSTRATLPLNTGSNPPYMESLSFYASKVEGSTPFALLGVGVRAPLRGGSIRAPTPLTHSLSLSAPTPVAGLEVTGVPSRHPSTRCLMLVSGPIDTDWSTERAADVSRTFAQYLARASWSNPTPDGCHDGWGTPADGSRLLGRHLNWTVPSTDTGLLAGDTCVRAEHPVVYHPIYERLEGDERTARDEFMRLEEERLRVEDELRRHSRLNSDGAGAHGSRSRTSGASVPSDRIEALLQNRRTESMLRYDWAMAPETAYVFTTTGRAADFELVRAAVPSPKAALSYMSDDEFAEWLGRGPAYGETLHMDWVGPLPVANPATLQDPHPEIRASVPDNSSSSSQHGPPPGLGHEGRGGYTDTSDRLPRVSGAEQELLRLEDLVSRMRTVRQEFPQAKEVDFVFSGHPLSNGRCEQDNPARLSPPPPRLKPCGAGWECRVRPPLRPDP